VKKLKEMKLKNAAELVAEGIEETLSYYHFPQEHWRRIRTNNPLERIMKEIRRRTRLVGAFPDGESALMLAAARLTGTHDDAGVLEWIRGYSDHGCLVAGVWG